MKNALFPNDVIIVNKLKYGPKLPRSPFDIPLVNIAYYFNETQKNVLKSIGGFIKDYLAQLQLNKEMLSFLTPFGKKTLF